MNERYMILIRPEGRSRLIPCDDGDTCTLRTMQTLVDGPIEVTESHLGPCWAREPVDGIRLIVNEEGKLRGLPLNRKATELLYKHGSRDALVGAVLLAAVRGEELIGFSIHVCRTISDFWNLEMEE
nr:MAG TPA: protein of unknown function DUF3846 [Caudoviricetes sp.]